MTRTLLLDGDILAYKAAAAAQQVVDWGDVVSVYADKGEAEALVKSSIDRLMDQSGASALIVALSCDAGNWRRDVLPSYKHNRDPSKVPMLRMHLKQHIRDTFKVYERPTLEGDDVLGILMTSTKIIPGEKFIVSEDKDLKTVPGLHWNPDDKDLVEITEDQADRFHLIQSVSGDPTDGYSGCPGIGKKRATELVASSETLVEAWGKIVKAYAKKNLGPEEALAQARVARICRVTDYDFVTKQVKLWEPPSDHD